MATPLKPFSLSVHNHLQASAQMALRVHSAFCPGLKGSSPYSTVYTCKSTMKSNGFYRNTRPKIYCVINMAAGQAGEPEDVNFQHLINKARKLWDSVPQPVKSFPWNRAFENFVQLILDLVLAVIKYLSVPLLAVSSLSEMSYCAHQKKLFLIPLPLLIGIAVAGVLRESALELSPRIKDAEVPWHLIAMAVFFTLFKLLGPYYPYWGRIFLPHLANGALWRIMSFMFLWYRRPNTSDRGNLAA